MQLVTVGAQPGGKQMCLVGSQKVPVGHAPQSIDRSQPSPIVPQYWPPWNAHESAVQLGLPQMPATLAPQLVPVGQALPQSTDALQPSPTTPQ